MILKGIIQFPFDDAPSICAGSPSKASELDFIILKKLKIGRAGGRTDGRTDERAEGRTDGRADGRTDGRKGHRPCSILSSAYFDAICDATILWLQL